MNRIIIFIHIFLALACCSYTNVAMAQTTGSLINNAPHYTPETVVWFNEPREITDIRLLLQNGKKQEALTLAREYLRKLHGIAGMEAKVLRYYGINAMCVALTSNGELHEAITTCSRAINMFPTRWQAINNRGVAHYMSGNFDQALKDYNLALTHVQASKPLTKLIQHNIDLANAKKSGTPK